MADQLIDETDREILELLREDARRTLGDIGARVTLSTAAVKRRIDRMQENGVIVGYTVQIDHAKLGWGIEAFTELRFTGTTKVGEIVRTTTRMPEAQAVFTIMRRPRRARLAAGAGHGPPAAHHRRDPAASPGDGHEDPDGAGLLDARPAVAPPLVSG